MLDKRSLSLLLAGALLLTVAPASAGTITYEEILSDARSFFPPLDVLRNLERTRDLGDGSPPQFEGNDPTIVLQNSVSDNFGRQSADPVTYSHLFFPAAPVGAFQLAELEIVVGSVSGEPTLPGVLGFIQIALGLGTPNDEVEVDGNFIGFLTPTNPFATSTFQFSTGDAAQIALLLLDNRIDVTVTPLGPGIILEPEPDGDRISVRSSTFRVTFQVPEPATLLLLPVGLLGAAALGRRGRHARLR